MILHPPYAECDAKLGGKAIGLVRLYKSNMPVPDFIVIDGQFFSDDTSESKRGEIIKQAWDIASGWTPLAIRSSMAHEDQDRHACAGVAKTYLNVMTAADFSNRIYEIFNSMKTETLKAYFRKMGLAEQTTLSVIIQKQVIPSLSGVMFTCNPINMDRSHVEIEISHSCATHSVEGHWHERIGLDKVTREIRHYEARMEPSALNKNRIDALLDRAIESEKIFGKNIDVEWAIFSQDDKDTFFYLQIRPITALNR